MEDCIGHYFPKLTAVQQEQFSALKGLYSEWNSKINVISRKDIDNLYERHVLHSLSICELINFKGSSNIIDVGTGGGFPGIPLAIMFPQVHFHLVDSTGKKILVAQSIADTIGLKNVSTKHCRIEEEKGLFDFAVSRAVMPLPDLLGLCRKNISKIQKNSLPNGIICLKGGDLHDELKPFAKNATVLEISDFFSEEFFKEKKVIYLPVK